MPEHNTMPAAERDDRSTETTMSATVDKVLDAVRAHPGATNAQIAEAAGVGRSAPAKALAGLARENRITRTPGIRAGGNRAPDRWHPAAVDDQSTADTSSLAGPTDTADAQRSAEAPPAASPTPNEAASGTAQRPNRTAAEDKAATATSRQGKAAKPTAPKATADKEPEGATDPDGTQHSPGQRLKPGALRGMVEQHLADHPEQDYTPTALGHLLGRSSGAIANALEKLVADKYAVLVSRKPRTYRSTPPE